MNKILLKFKKLSSADIAAAVFLSAAFLYLFITAFFDGTISDEAFYISIPYRLINGDGLLTDEWHLSQLSSVLLYLPVKLFTLITGSSDGIILFMRILFCFMQLGTGIYTYTTFRKHGIPAILVSSAFMLFSLIGLNTLSYNTMGLALLIAVICTAFRLAERPSYSKIFAEGTLIAMFILCQPVGVVYYLLYFIAVIAINLRSRNNKKEVPFVFTAKAFSFSVGGILPVFAFFLYLLFSNSHIGDIIKSIPGIFSDVEHMTITQELGIKTFSLLQFFTDMTMAAGAVPLVLCTAVMIAAVISKRKNKTLSVVLTTASVAVLTLSFYFRLIFMEGKTETDDINFFFFPLALSGLFFFLLTDKKNYRIFSLLWCTGIMYALFMTISSNLGLHASVNGYIIACAGAVLLAKDLFNEIKQEKNENKLKKAALLLLTACISGFLAFNIPATVTDSAIKRFSFPSAEVTNGIYRGIRLPSDQALIYTNIYSDAQKIKEMADETDRLFVIENIPAMYLESELPMGTHSGWFICEQLAVPEVRDRFRSYYEIYPENIPSYLYIPACVYTEHGMKPALPKKMAEFGYSLFECEAPEDIGSGLLIKVTGIKNE